MTNKAICNPKQFEFVLPNILSVSKYLDVFKIFSYSLSQKPDIICPTETLLNPGYNKNCFPLNDSQKIMSSNRKKRGGCVVFFLKKQHQLSDSQKIINDFRSNTNRCQEKHNMKIVVFVNLHAPTLHQ